MGGGGGICAVQKIPSGEMFSEITNFGKRNY